MVLVVRYEGVREAQWGTVSLLFNQTTIIQWLEG